LTEVEIEIILQGGKEKHPEARPRIISDNGRQFIARDFEEFVRISGMTRCCISCITRDRLNEQSRKFSSFLKQSRRSVSSHFEITRTTIGGPRLTG